MGAPPPWLPARDRRYPGLVAREHDGGPAGRRWIPSARLVAAGVLFVLAVIFVFQNTEETEIRFVFPRVETPLWVALSVAIVIGMLVGLLLARGRGR